MNATNQPSCDHSVKYTWSQYRQYLKSVEWTMLRARALSMHGRRCQICRKDATQLHHLVYRQYPQDSIPDDLMPVCKDCHERIHAKFKCPMDRERVIRFFAKQTEKIIVLDEAWRKEQRKLAKSSGKGPPRVLTKKERGPRDAVQAEKRAQQTRNKKWEERWAWG